MNQKIIDPMKKYPNELNKSVLQYLKKQVVLATEKDGLFVLDGYQLHSHPDLQERLMEISAKFRGNCDGSVYGCPVLVGASGIIFAVAIGTSNLAFRLPDEDMELAIEFGGKPDGNFGRNWISFYAFNPDIPTKKLIGDLSFWCEKAFQYSLKK